MVGVQGKSKACGVCRQRRIKCDLRRPSCRTCQKGNRMCTGYDRNLVFVNRTTEEPSVTAVDVLSDLKRRRLVSETASPDQSTENDLQSLFLSLPPSQERFRSYALELLSDLYLPNQPVLDVAATQGTFSWVNSIAELEGPSAALDVSIYTFCLTQIYVTRSGAVTLERCLRWYDEALSRLRRDIENPDTQFSEETLAAIVALSTTELFINNATLDAWHVHAYGISQIIRARQQRINTPTWRHLFSRLRVICALEALTRRHANIIDTSVWQENESQVGLSGPLDELFMMFLDMPKVLELVDNVACNRQITTREFLDAASVLIRTLFGFVNQLGTWMEVFRKGSTEPRFWSIPSSTTSPADPDADHKVFPFCIEFASLNTALPITMSWSVQVQLYSDIIQLYELVKERVSANLTLGDILDHCRESRAEAACTLLHLRQAEPTEDGGEHPTIEELKTEATKRARFVCQALEFYHRKENGAMGAQATTYPQWVVRQYFRFHPGHEIELAWCKNVRYNKAPGTEWNYQITGFTDLKGPIGTPR